MPTSREDKDELHLWLNAFFDRVEKGRLQRGRILYLDEALEQFQHDEAGFTAQIQGSKGHIYTANARTNGYNSNGWPAMEHIQFTCTCPDHGEPICKHVVCATIHWSHILKKGEHHVHPQINDNQALSAQLEELSKHAQQCKWSLPKLIFSTSSFNIQLEQKVHLVHQRVRRQLWKHDHDHEA